MMIFRRGIVLLIALTFTTAPIVHACSSTSETTTRENNPVLTTNIATIISTTTTATSTISATINSVTTATTSTTTTTTNTKTTTTSTATTTSTTTTTMMTSTVDNCITLTNGDLGFCSCQSCSENEGDCDFHSECQGDLRCGSNMCPDSYGFDSNIDCCYAFVIGTEYFCSIGQTCDADEGDCDSDDECRSYLFCGSNNCPDSLGVSPEVDCCEPKESCELNHCQDGIEVFFATETQQYYTSISLYGHYELQPSTVNGKPFFKTDSYGFWWDGIEYWVVGHLDVLGQSIGYAFYQKDVYCPSMLSEFHWIIWDGSSFLQAGNHFGVTCNASLVLK